jgi:hypothetical protein
MESAMREPPESMAEDLLEGIARIAWYVGQPTRRTNYLLRTGRLPGGKVGTGWVASKRTLREFYEQVTSGRKV